MVIVKNLYIVTKNFTGKIIYNNHFLYVKDGNDHRYYGPQEIWINNFSYKEWWFNNQFYGGWSEKEKMLNYSQKQFIKDLNRLWLL